MNIKSWIYQGENEVTDFKHKISGYEKIAKTLVAFANHKGGRLLVGVADNGTINGVKNEEEQRFILEKAATSYCKPAVTLHFDEEFVDDKLVLVANIIQSDTKPHYALDEKGKWWVYVRIGDESVLASKIMLEVLKRSNTDRTLIIQYTEKENQLLKHIHQHKKATFDELHQALAIPKRKAQHLLVNMILAGLIQIIHEQHGEFYMEKSP